MAVNKYVYVIMRRAGDSYEYSDDAVVAFLELSEAKKFDANATSAWNRLKGRLDAWGDKSNELYQDGNVTGNFSAWNKWDERKPKLRTPYDKNVSEDTQNYWIETVRLVMK